MIDRVRRLLNDPLTFVGIIYFFNMEKIGEVFFFLYIWICKHN